MIIAVLDTTLWVQACGSGGTTAGLALGLHLSGSGLAMVSYGVCDSPKVFYSDVDGLLEGLGHDTSSGKSRTLNIPIKHMLHYQRRGRNVFEMAIVSPLFCAGRLAPQFRVTHSDVITCAGGAASDIFAAHQAKGLGYAMSSEAELRFTLDVAQQTGGMSVYVLISFVLHC